MLYIELFDSVGMKLPIEKIIIGPNKNKEARKAELIDFVGSNEW
jgi:hypothetical protein